MDLQSSSTIILRVMALKKRSLCRNLAPAKESTRALSLTRPSKTKKDLPVEQPIVQVHGPADVTDGDCNGQGLQDLREAEQFSCGCKQIEFKAQLEDQRSGCIVQFAPADVLAYNVSFKDMERVEKDMMIIGVVSSCMRNGQTTLCRKRIRQTEREKSRSDYIFDGRRVCTKFFLKLVGISPKKLRALQNHYKQYGLEPRKLKSGSRKNNTKALSVAETERIVTFIKQYAEDHAVHLPGRIPGFKRDDIQLLPSSAPKSRVYSDYLQSAARAGHTRIVYRATFGKIWLQLCPFIVVARRMAVFCWRCQNNNTRIFRSANLTEEEKTEIILEQQHHLSNVNAERKFNNELVHQSKETAQQHGLAQLQRTPANSSEIEMHYSFDFAQQVHLPSNAAQPGPMYFLTPRKYALFGVCCEGVPQQVNFIVDESVNVSKGSLGVISYLDFFFQNYGLGEKRVHLHCDNCSGQNKNNYVLWYFAWRVMKGLKSLSTSCQPDIQNLRRTLASA